MVNRTAVRFAVKGEAVRAADQGLRLITELAQAENWLAVLVTQRPAGEPAVSLVNAGILAHPVSGEPVLGFVARGATRKLINLRHTPQATLVFRSGWEWAAVSGPVVLAGPDDHDLGLQPDQLTKLLRDIYHAAGGQHSDLAEYDRAMAAERRTAALLAPLRFTTNPTGADHQEPR
jgi:hypothetical protein